jgi:asparagine synthase (glutamine-hydrolysing)
MCGIAGFVRAAGTRSGDEALLRAMCDAIQHRGPDDDGRKIIGSAALGMRRLSIIDVAGGQQPITNETNDVTVVFNGEIYNYHELRDRLLKAGHRLTTRSDTETLVHLYEDDGDRLVDSLRGMYGFAIWDSRRQRLLLARDRLGIKPLYYWERPDGISFASELRSFLVDPSFKRELSEEAVALYLSFGYVPDPSCIFRGVRKLPPGHVLTWNRDDGVSVHRYWSPLRPEVSIEIPEAVTELRRILDESVRCHLESEVPLGAFLSGGIDSSTVVALMARAMDRKVQTFSIGFDEPEYNEAPHAARVAAVIGTDHTELIVRPDADQLVDDVIQGFDEPFADSSALPTLLVSHLAREKVTVALSGDGGDELFGGYTRYAQVAGMESPAPAAVRRILRGLALMRAPGATGRAWMLNRAREWRGRYAAQVAEPLSLREGGLSRDQVASHAPQLENVLDPWFDRFGSRDFATQMMLVDLETYLPGDILTKVDRMSMAVSLEARVPILDHHVVEFAMSLPSRLKMRDGVGKWLLRKAIEGLVPETVLTKPKQGFAVPLDHWFRGPLRHRIEALARPDTSLYDWVDADSVRRICAEHIARRRDHQGTIWRLMVLDGWLRALNGGALAGPQTVHDLLRRSAIGAVHAAPVRTGRD